MRREPTERGARLTAIAARCGAALLLFAAAAAAQDVLLTGGRLVDPRTRQVTEENLLILDGVIAGRPAAVPEGFDGEVVDVAGKWVIPGLHDLHVHSSSSRGGERFAAQLTARRMLWAGVTGHLDLLSMEPFIFTLRDRQRSRPHPEEADIFAAGPVFEAPHFGGDVLGRPVRSIDTPEAARREIAALARKRRPDVIKLIYGHPSPGSVRPQLERFDRETLAGAVAAADELGIPTVVHVQTWPDVRDAAAVGASAVTHTPSEAVVPPDIVELMRASATAIIPTLANADVVMWNEPEILDSPMLVALTDPRALEDYRRQVHEEEPSRWVAALNRVQPRVFESLRLLDAAGVTILSGTDAGNVGVIHGHALHHELRLMVDAGLDPWVALASSTHLAGEFLGRSWGLAPGDQGSVVVLDGSPIDDIRNTQAIAAVVHHGVVVDREALARKLFAGRWTGDFTVALAKTFAHMARKTPWWAVAALALLGGVLFGPAVARRLGRLRPLVPTVGGSRASGM